MAGRVVNTRSMNDGGWYWINRSVLRSYVKDIGIVGLAVYNCLASFADTSQTCYPTQEQIGNILGLSRVTVNKAVRRLADKGLITVDKSRRCNCIYSLCKAVDTGGVKKRNISCKATEH